MNKGVWITYGVPVLFICLFFISIIGYMRQEDETFEEYVLQQQVDYATDAAVQELLLQADLGVDYSMWGRVALDPDAALDTFTKVMCLNYNQPLTDVAMSRMQNDYLPMFAVCCYDGYYVYNWQERSVSNSVVKELTKSVKMPYSYTTGTAAAGDRKQYALNLGFEKCYMYDEQENDLLLVNAPIDAESQARIINARVSDDLASRYQAIAALHRVPRLWPDNWYEDSGVTQVYIPEGLTSFSSINTLSGPTVIAIIDEWDLTTTKEVSAFSIGGSTVKPARMVVSYLMTVNGVSGKYYCYADLLDEAFVQSASIIGMYGSITEAARNGAYPDPIRMR